jgi:hypothetical protein
MNNVATELTRINLFASFVNDAPSASGYGLWRRMGRMIVNNKPEGTWKEALVA